MAGEIAVVDAGKSACFSSAGDSTPSASPTSLRIISGVIMCEPIFFSRCGDNSQTMSHSWLSVPLEQWCLLFDHSYLILLDIRRFPSAYPPSYPLFVVLGPCLCGWKSSGQSIFSLKVPPRPPNFIRMDLFSRRDPLRNPSRCFDITLGAFWTD